MMKKYPVVVILLFFLLSQMAWAGDYMNSAHGDLNNGVFRTAMGTLGYAKGNCAHCHEMHASIKGSNGSPAPFTLFATNFNTTAIPGSYLEADNFCFYCHNSSGSAQQVANYDYSETFGCATAGGGPTSIRSAFNQISYHNLEDIWSFAEGNFSWFKEYSNPCNACHNPHLAKRNWTDPLLSAMSKPSDHFSLWGTTELMSSSYEAPYCSVGTREPDGGSNTPDYVGFCTDCHNSSIPSTSMGTVGPINWSSGDKHGQQPRNGGIDIEEPYASATNSNFVLSCLDCHEPHGSQNVVLIRRRVNGGDLGGGAITTIEKSSISAPAPGPGDDNTELGCLCYKCHYGGNTKANNCYIHHTSGDAPYSKTMCKDCHYDKSGGGHAGFCDKDVTKICCNNCHFHNGNDDWAGTNKTGRKTF